MTLNCPACSANVVFKSRSSVFAVCSYCSSTLVRHDMNLEDIGKMAQLPPDMSPLQVGSSGKFQNKHFQVLGKKKLSWADGLWNEWFVMFVDGQEGWLAEAQGTWAISFLSSHIAPPLKELKLGKEVEFGNVSFTLTDIKTAVCNGSMGELPQTAKKNQYFINVDFIGPNGKFACIDYSGDLALVYVGQFLEFDDFDFQNLKDIDGW